MEKKTAKKAVKNKLAEPKKAVITSPFDEVAVDLPIVEAKSVKPKKVSATATVKKAAAKKTAKRPVSEPPVVTAGSVEVSSSKKTIKKKTTITEPVAATSPVKKRAAKKAKAPTLDATAEIAATEPKVELSPVFKALAEPKLPELQKENRARLMMQTPTQLYFYWSVRENPYQLLHKAFGDDTGSYTLVLKLTELNRGIEEIHRAEPEGNYWFAVEPNGKYEAEIGFYAPNRPYFRIIYSNTIETPRRNPSPHPASEAHWRVPAQKFAEVLDVAGFSQDAFNVAMAGDDLIAAEDATHAAFNHLIGARNYDLRSIAAEDLRYTLMAIAAGVQLEELRSRVSAALFAILQQNAERIAAGNAKNVLTEYFDIDESEFTEYEYGSAVYGASLVNFPRTLKTRVTKYMPVGSHSLR